MHYNYTNQSEFREVVFRFFHHIHFMVFHSDRKQADLVVKNIMYLFTFDCYMHQVSNAALDWITRGVARTSRTLVKLSPWK